jgi:hypothetical protein
VIRAAKRSTVPAASETRPAAPAHTTDEHARRAGEIAWAREHLFGDTYSGVVADADTRLALNALLETRLELEVAAEALRTGDEGYCARFSVVVGSLAHRLEHIETILFAAVREGGAS